MIFTSLMVSPRKSFGVTAPPVAAAIRAAASRETQAGSSLHRAVMLAGDKPQARANALRVVPVAVSQSASFMGGSIGARKFIRNEISLRFQRY
ncbi:hypothetical protein [Ancylobacter sonchi]|uniref:hypothetical protein n=1 Tax=Ancylobacter sonchi TaxID=1937790 RepID=UPI001FE4D8E0|nr:hypothetical protein [Ancylobacter sonchi]